MSVPEQYGGLGLTARKRWKCVFELGQSSPAFRSRLGTNVGIGSQGIVLDGTEEQKNRYLPKDRLGRNHRRLALTEPDAARTRARSRPPRRRNGNGYVVNGTKRFITNARRSVALYRFCAHRSQIQGDQRRFSVFSRENSPGYRSVNTIKKWVKKARIPAM